jgi:hypothetical protein
VDEGVVKIHSRVGIGHFGVVGGARVPVAQNNIVQPIRNHALRVHQLPDRLQHRLEVVLFGLAPHQDVELLVDVFLALVGVVHVVSVLVAVQPDPVGSLVSGEYRSGLGTILDDSPVHVQHPLDLAPSDAVQTHLGYEGLLVVVLGADGVRGFDGDQEADVVLSEVLPFGLDLGAHRQVDGHVGSHPAGALLPDVGLGHLDDGEVEDGLGHPGPSAPIDGVVFGSPRRESADGVLDVLSDLIRRLQPKQVEVPQEVVVEGEELEVELGQRETTLPREVRRGDDVLVPDYLLGGVERHLVQSFQLRSPPLVPRHQKLAQELFVQPAPVDLLLFTFRRHQFQVSGDESQLVFVQRPEVFHQSLARVHAGDVGQGEVTQIGKFGEGRFLKRGDFRVVQLCHVVVGEGITRFVTDLEPRVELQHVQELAKKMSFWPLHQS